MLSLVIPSYNEELNICAVAKVITQLLDQHKITYEIIFVDDGSVDQTFKMIETLAKENPKIRGIKFSRNYGKEAAIIAGLKSSKGKCCAVMDGDLQHPPEHLITMYDLWKQGYVIVEGVKTSRGKESWIYSKFSKLYYKIINNFIDMDLSGASDYKLLDRKIVDILIKLPEKDTFFRGLSLYFGFPRTTVEFEVAERASGETKWTLFGLFRYAVNSLSSFTAFPLYLITMVGSFLLLIFFILGIQTLYNYLVRGAVEGFTTVILLLLLIGSTTLISMGIIGHYIAKIYEEVKGRPRYIVEKMLPNQDLSLEGEIENE
ncbi:dolichol-phosphate mannosyltransferase [Desulfonispora thiosulfatigenes DSM 11270]|uniref:Dolichol-phosphate mannosyltransferase n=1 Tax=Desulfonispora thiosulfatigenes DSM 11270 TaxID=656914 RepID=A0A1W1UJI5_DESTI|nr:glycosyltransferase family 2 protein [Desulfonispora thiosulfatigenes]SMB80904.1 dolichol-phosphate mannosyltransferase [Desulfonispora thiosulfatigenes DSM 11270]